MTCKNIIFATILIGICIIWATFSILTAKPSEQTWKDYVPVEVVERAKLAKWECDTHPQFKKCNYNNALAAVHDLTMVSGVVEGQ